VLLPEPANPIIKIIFLFFINQSDIKDYQYLFFAIPN